MAYPWSELAHLGSFFYVNDDHTMEQDENTRKAHKELSNDRVAVNEFSETQLAIKISLLDQLDIKNKALYEENLQLKRDKDSLEKEKDEVLSRLSKLAGQKLTKGNPQITDLSDPNRPAKIGDRWGSLYTDEWTDAYEDLVKNQRNGNDVPEKRLLDIVDWCYKKCLEIAENQGRAIKKNLWNVVRQIHFLGIETDAPIENKRVYGSGLENTILLQSMEAFLDTATIQRQRSPCLNDAVKNKCKEDYCKLNPMALSSEKIFVEKCSDLCWVMCSSDPPMVIEYDNFKGQVLDTGKFNKYNRSGTNVEFIVWPVLLLHKNGPVLAKGTAQTNDEQIDKDCVILDGNEHLQLTASAEGFATTAKASTGCLADNGQIPERSENQANRKVSSQQKQDINEELSEKAEHQNLIWTDSKGCADKETLSLKVEAKDKPNNESEMKNLLSNQTGSTGENLETDGPLQTELLGAESRTQSGLDNDPKLEDRASNVESNEKYEPNFTSSQLRKYDRRISQERSEISHTETTYSKSHNGDESEQQAVKRFVVDPSTRASLEKGTACSAEGEKIQNSETQVERYVC